jgi:hypothetical protein
MLENKLLRVTSAFTFAFTYAIAGCSSDSKSGSGTTSTTTEPILALVRAPLATSDAAAARAKHEELVTRDRAKTPARTSHKAMIGTTILDTKANEILVLDVWTDETAMKAYYADSASFDGLATNITVEYFTAAASWAQWGDMHSGESSPPYFTHLALGTLADPDVEKDHAAHDKVASGGKQPSLDAGNLAHVVWLGETDKHRFVGIDIWAKSDPIQPFYTSPQFVQAFAPLFSSVTQPVYESTDWSSW